MSDLTAFLDSVGGSELDCDSLYYFDENEDILDAARRLKFNKKTDHWVTTETGSHLMIRGGKVVGGAGGKLNGLRKGDNQAKKAKFQEKFTKKIHPQLDKKSRDEVHAIGKKEGVKGLLNTDSHATLKRKIVSHFVDRELDRDRVNKSGLLDSTIDDDYLDTSNIVGWFDNTGD